MNTEHFINNPSRNLDTGIISIAHLGQMYRCRIIHAAYRNIPSTGPLNSNLHKHDVYHFVFISGGAGHVILDNETIKVEPGWLLITSPDQFHYFGNLPGDSKDYCEVTFEFLNEKGDALTIPFSKVLEIWSGRSCQIIDRVFVKPELHHLIIEKIRILVMTGKNQNYGFSLDIITILSDIFRDLFLNLFSTDIRSRTKNPILEIHDYLHKNFQKKISLEDLSKLTGLSKNYISRKFKDDYGQTPINYLQEIRMEAAQIMLKNTEYPIKQVGEIVGYDDVYFFSKVFKTLTKLPPGKYRKLHQKTN